MELSQHDGRACLALIDKVRVPELEDLRQLAITAAATTGDVDLDLGRSDHLHAGALQILLALEHAVRGRGAALRVTGLSPAARAALVLAGLGSWTENC